MSELIERAEACEAALEDYQRNRWRLDKEFDEVETRIRGYLAECNTLKAKIERLQMEHAIDYYTSALVSPKPIVWIREDLRGCWGRCDENGQFIKNVGAFLGPSALQIFLDGIVDVRVWEEPAKEPETVWEYGVWETNPGRFNAYTPSGCVGGSQYNSSDIQEAVTVLLNQQASIASPLNECRQNSGIPTFGVRRLTEEEEGRWGDGALQPYGSGEWHVPFYKGKPIEPVADMADHKPERCIRKVLAMLTPAVPAVKLADLEVSDA
ncbi:MAG TPA: hypothetical protein ENL23_01625 [Candidatus Acetothermia bacterium]|nr:hypothetical protein [Candidatus Acetothermia bacterium]